MNSKTSNEFEAFDSTVRNLLKVSSAEIKAKLEEEKAARKRKKSKKSSASGRAAGDRV